ncbi:aldehyde dehydrogenase family protein [Marinobacterium rhizophilum]|uniref:Aldehyde dehydrogenase family protein n=1 Tax=Marinobacterium rhizophilum TaxID=420402 RepID=A0ABY5HN55_9GAMM|nr:aldehyde dehydrogenase family protein [Marinobacterium rhizophilum]UTW12635.1 aldehyde dehydrogenase family protein [Marinobacterium rhizophilum]
MYDKLFINGDWVAPQTASTLAVFNPATEELIAEVGAGTAADVERAVRAAKSALPAWRQTRGAERAGYLRAIAREIERRADSLAALSSSNNGKPLFEARIDIDDAIACWDYYANLAEQLDGRQNAAVPLAMPGYRASTRLEAAGVVGLIVPWNFPFVTTAWKVAPALAAGCTAILKPSEVTPLIELQLGDIAQRVGLPAGVLNIVCGSGSDVGSALTRHPDIDKISFTGSNRVGEIVMQSAAEQVKGLSLELGGKSPMLVFEDADLDQAIDWILGGIFYNAGQMCSATSRLLVHERIAPQLLARLKTATEALQLGDAFENGVQMGPLTSKAQLDTVMGYIDRGRTEGLQLLTGGQRPNGFERGYFVEPTIFVDVPTESALWREEIFGPVLCVRTFASEAEAIALANDSDFGLAAGIISQDGERAQRVAEQLQAGHIWINSLQVVCPETSWGGFKRSGIGRELGPWGLSAYLEVKTITQPVTN